MIQAQVRATTPPSIEVVEAGIHLVVRTMIASYGDQAAESAANRARVLEACGDRDTSRYWDLVRERIDDLDRMPPRRGRYFSDDDPDLIAAVREGVFGDRSRSGERDDESVYEGDSDSFEDDGESRPSSK